MTQPTRTTSLRTARPWTAVAILIAVSLAVFIRTEWQIRDVVASFDSTSSARPLPAESFARLVPRIEKQKEQYSSWAYTALAAIVAISVVKRVLPSPWVRWNFVSLGPAAVLLLQTLRAGVDFDQRMTFLSLKGTMNLSQFTGVQTLLGFQVRWLSAGLVLLLLFVGSFVVAIVAGRLNLGEVTGES